MLTFWAQTGGTLLVCAILLGIITLIIRHLIKRKKRGPCMSCDGCGHRTQCSAAINPESDHT